MCSYSVDFSAKISTDFDLSIQEKKKLNTFLGIQNIILMLCTTTASLSTPKQFLNIQCIALGY